MGDATDLGGGTCPAQVGSLGITAGSLGSREWRGGPLVQARATGPRVAHSTWQWHARVEECVWNGFALTPTARMGGAFMLPCHQTAVIRFFSAHLKFSWSDFEHFKWFSRTGCGTPSGNVGLLPHAFRPGSPRPPPLHCQPPLHIFLPRVLLIVAMCCIYAYIAVTRAALCTRHVIQPPLVGPETPWRHPCVSAPNLALPDKWRD